MLKTIFMGTPPLVLPALESLHKNSDLSLIITGADKHIGRGKKRLMEPEPKKFAIKNNIDLVQVENIKDDKLLEKLKEIQPDLIIVFAFGFILPKNIFDIPKLGTVNIHTSLLPKYRGASPIHSALLNKDKVTGITFQKINEKLDSGDILFTKEVEILNNDDYLSLNEKLSTSSDNAMAEFLKLLENNELTAKAQNHSEATYCKKINKTDGEFFWKDTSDDIIAKVKAFVQWPVAFVNSKIGKLRVYKAETYTDNEIENYDSGQIINADKNGLIVKCKNSAINIKELQPENKRRMDYISFLNGHRLKSGEFL